MRFRPAMTSSALSHARGALGALLGAFLLASCGGGGSNTPAASTTPAAPVIQAVLFSFPSGVMPPSAPVTTTPGSIIEVAVLDGNSGAALTTATVTFNGTALTYDSTQGAFTGSIAYVGPSGAANLSVTVNGTSYTVSGTQEPTYPTITAPAASASWSRSAANTISWTGSAPDANSAWVIGIDDASGNLSYPTNGSFLTLASTVSPTLSLSANLLPATGSFYLLVGVSDTYAISGTGTNSGMAVLLGSFVPITVTP